MQCMDHASDLASSHTLAIEVCVCENAARGTVVERRVRLRRGATQHAGVAVVCCVVVPSTDLPAIVRSAPGVQAAFLLWFHIAT